jgi:ketosteroid isomerase-like protein
MNKPPSTVSLTLMFAAVASLSLLAAEPISPSAEADLRATIAELRTASVEGDTQKIVAAMTDDYLQTDISGVVQNKETWLKNYFIPLAELIKAGKFRWETYDVKDLEIRIHGDTGIVIGALEAKGSGARFDVEQHTWVADPNASFSGRLRFTRVYIRRDGKWLLAALQNAIPPSPAAAKSRFMWLSKSSNRALERTATRRVFTFQKIKTVSVEAALAFGGGRSAFSS